MHARTIHRLLMAVLVLIGGYLHANAQSESAYEVDYAPLYRGLDSQGGQPITQSPNPLFFFEEKVNWPALKIDQPRTAWEYAQRGIYRQDEIRDLAGAKADYQQSEQMNNRILIVQARLGVIALQEKRYDDALTHLEHVLEEAPFHEGTHLKLAKVYEGKGDLVKAVDAYQKELELVPNNQASHFALAKLLSPFALAGTCAATFGAAKDCRQDAINALDNYLRQARWHSDTQPIRILQARRLCLQLSATVPPETGCQ